MIFVHTFIHSFALHSILNENKAFMFYDLNLFYLSDATDIVENAQEAAHHP